MNPSLEIEHIGIAVESIEKAFEFYKGLGYSKMKSEVVPSEQVKVGFIEFANHVHIELLEPTGPESPIAKFLAKRGPGIHHICIKTDHIDSQLQDLKKAGIHLINETPKLGAKNCMVAFVHPSSANGVLIELSQEAK